MGSNFPPREVSTMKGNFQKQRHDELSHWNEWKHWVHGRAVESHDFEDKKMGRWARLGDRMMMMTDKMISDWCQNCDEIQMFAVICCSVLWTFRLPRIVRCFRFFFPTITTTCQPQLFLRNHCTRIASSWTMAKCQQNCLVKEFSELLLSPVRSFVRCLRIQSSSHSSIVHWALRLDEGCRSISALASVANMAKPPWGGGFIFWDFWDSNGFKTSIHLIP